MTDTQDYNQQLQILMQRVDIPSFRSLAIKAGVSHWQVTQLRRGNALQMRADNLLKLANILEVPLGELLEKFSSGELAEQRLPQTSDRAVESEYERLQVQMQQQRETLLQEFQQASLNVLESWLLQWPTAAYAAQQNPQVSAAKVLPLLRPVEQLVQQWGLEAIAPVGSQVPYDPQLHQLMEGTAQHGDPVKVRYTGYRQGDRLLYRAKVSPVNS